MIDEFAGQSFDYVLTVRDHANETCPVSPGHANLLYHSFEDPATAAGSEAERLTVFRRVRDEIRECLCNFRGRY